jgi:hypothetical protein
MPRSMTDPDYVYKPWTQERRNEASKIARARHGIVMKNVQFKRKLGYVQTMSFNIGFEAGVSHAIRMLKMQKRRKP